MEKGFIRLVAAGLGLGLLIDIPIEYLVIGVGYKIISVLGLVWGVSYVRRFVRQRRRSL